MKNGKWNHMKTIMEATKNPEQQPKCKYIEKSKNISRIIEKNKSQKHKFLVIAETDLLVYSFNLFSLEMWM